MMSCPSQPPGTAPPWEWEKFYEQWEVYRNRDEWITAKRKTTQPVIGHWTMKKYLMIRSKKSRIDITVSLAHQECWPRLLQLRTCGHHPINVEVHGGGTGINMNTFKIDIETEKGDITATLPHYYNTSLRTECGTIKANIHPYSYLVKSAVTEKQSHVTAGPPNSIKPSLETETRTTDVHSHPRGTITQYVWTDRPSNIELHQKHGNMEIAIHPYAANAQQSLTHLSTDCHAFHGKVKLLYPPTWAGKVYACNQKGNVKIHFPHSKSKHEGDDRWVTVGKGEGKIGIKGHGHKDLDVEVIANGVATDEYVQAGPSGTVSGSGDREGEEEPPPSYDEVVRY